MSDRYTGPHIHIDCENPDFPDCVVVDRQDTRERYIVRRTDGESHIYKVVDGDLHLLGNEEREAPPVSDILRLAEDALTQKHSDEAYEALLALYDEDGRDEVSKGAQARILKLFAGGVDGRALAQDFAAELSGKDLFDSQKTARILSEFEGTDFAATLSELSALAAA